MMVRRLVARYLAGLFLMSCAADSVPNGLLSKEEMANFVYDMSLISGIKNYDLAALREKEIKPTEYLLEKYQLDSLKLTQTVEFYSSHPEILAEVYKEAMRKMTQTQEKLNAPVESNP